MENIRNGDVDWGVEMSMEEGHVSMKHGGLRKKVRTVKS